MSEALPPSKCSSVRLMGSLTDRPANLEPLVGLIEERVPKLRRLATYRKRRPAAINSKSVCTGVARPPGAPRSARRAQGRSRPERSAYVDPSA